MLYFFKYKSQLLQQSFIIATQKVVTMNRNPTDTVCIIIEGELKQSI